MHANRRELSFFVVDAAYALGDLTQILHLDGLLAFLLGNS